VSQQRPRNQFDAGCHRCLAASTHVDVPERVVTLRDETGPGGTRHLRARFRECGDLVIEGHDLGPGTKPVSSDGEYEWFITIRREHLDRLRASIGADSEEDLLSFLERNFSGTASYELEPNIRAGDVPREFFSC
jgi:hypothetical protein